MRGVLWHVVLSYFAFVLISEQSHAQSVQKPLTGYFNQLKVYDDVWGRLPKHVVQTGGYAARSVSGNVIQVKTDPTENGSPYFQSLTQLNFENINLDQSKLFAIYGVFRVLSAPANAEVSLTIWGAGQNPVRPERFSNLGSITLRNGASLPFVLSLRDWTIKNSFTLTLHVSARGSSEPVIANIENAILFPYAPMPKLALERPNLAWFRLPSPAHPENPPLNVFDPIHAQKIDLMAGLGARAIRFGIRGANTLPRTLGYLRRAAAHKQEILVTVMPDASDYPNFTSGVHSTYNRGKEALILRKVDTARFRSRVDAHLRAFKLARIPIALVQFGNEFDGGFAGDRIYEGQGNIFSPAMFPLDDPQYLLPMIQKYAEMLRITYEVTKKYYPKAKIVSQAGANLDAHAYAFNPSQVEIIDGVKYVRGMTRPKHFIQGLLNVGGVNYLEKYVDCIGQNVYPQYGDRESIRSMLQTIYASQGVPLGKPICITEFGFKIPGALGGNWPFTPADRYGAFRNFIEALIDLAPIHPTLFASLHQADIDGAEGTPYSPSDSSAVHNGYGIWDTRSGTPLPGAEIFHQYNPRRR